MWKESNFTLLYLYHNIFINKITIDVVTKFENKLACKRLVTKH